MSSYGVVGTLLPTDLFFLSLLCPPITISTNEVGPGDWEEDPKNGASVKVSLRYVSPVTETNEGTKRPSQDDPAKLIKILIKEK